MLKLKGKEAAKTKIGVPTMTKIVDYYEGGIAVRIIDTPSLKAKDQ